MGLPGRDPVAKGVARKGCTWRGARGGGGSAGGVRVGRAGGARGASWRRSPPPGGDGRGTESALAGKPRGKRPARERSAPRESALAGEKRRAKGGDNAIGACLEQRPIRAIMSNTRAPRHARDARMSAGAAHFRPARRSSMCPSGGAGAWAMCGGLASSHGLLSSGESSGAPHISLPRARARMMQAACQVWRVGRWLPCRPARSWLDARRVKYAGTTGAISGKQLFFTI